METETQAPNQKSTNQNMRLTSSKAAALLAVVAVVAVSAALLIHNNKTKQSAGTASIVAPAYVSITKDGFLPATLQVKAGSSVTWTNNDGAVHQVAADPYPKDDSISGFDSQEALQPKDTLSFKFSKPGTYTLHDEKNPFKFKATVIVKQ